MGDPLSGEEHVEVVVCCDEHVPPIAAARGAETRHGSHSPVLRFEALGDCGTRADSARGHGPGRSGNEETGNRRMRRHGLAVC